MNIEFTNNASDSFPWGFFVLWGMIWLGFLYRILTRDDFDTATKILWVVVVIFVPFFGMALYCAAAPAPVRTTTRRNIDGIRPESDVAGTPWDGNPGFTSDK